eukprot:216702-Rhodomonas_salina.1
MLGARALHVEEHGIAAEENVSEQDSTLLERRGAAHARLVGARDEQRLVRDRQLLAVNRHVHVAPRVLQPLVLERRCAPHSSAKREKTALKAWRKGGRPAAALNSSGGYWKCFTKSW